MLGSVTYPFPETTDFSAYLQQALVSGAKVLGLCNGGVDTVNSVKQAHEFGLNQNMLLAAMLMTVADAHALGSATAQGLRLTESFYWDLNDRTRAFVLIVLRPKIGKGPDHVPGRRLCGIAALPQNGGRYGRGRGEGGRPRDGGRA